ncbi:MAG: metallophosphoesterase family protein [Clostridia bacterium]|nr:metallophosphoesterase family protein [Clostridia bacterium]
MKIGFMCDLHLPFDKNALQYDVLEWAVSDILKNRPDCVCFAGDATCDGNAEVYEGFIEKMKGIGIPFIYVPGNSDLRNAESRDRIAANASPLKNAVGGITVYAINDCGGSVSEGCLAELESAGAGDVVFMHHPPRSLAAWRLTHPDTAVFYGHLHRSEISGKDISLQALDPDKAIGECPCISYYNTESGVTEKAYFNCPVPDDMYPCFGISCYDPIAQTEFAVEKGLKYLELRPNCISADRESLKALIEKWRECGGVGLSVHLPDVGWWGGELHEKNYDEVVMLASELGADRVTQHVPLASVGDIRRKPTVLEEICGYIAERLNAIEKDITVGVENMHMTAKESPDDRRRFGYTPEECEEFMERLSAVCRHHVGINLDIGHARNNAPYSQKYQIGTWYSMLGKHIVGYHVHQVKPQKGGYENHMPIDEVYGHLISYASLFGCWAGGKINKAPVIFEMRPENAYEITLATFERMKESKK